jgi:hypothetical protein
MTSLFDPITVGAINAPNRIMMAPLTRARATRSHIPTPLMGEYYSQRASAGLILSEATGISQQGLGWPSAPGLWCDPDAHQSSRRRSDGRKAFSQRRSAGVRRQRIGDLVHEGGRSLGQARDSVLRDARLTSRKHLPARDAPARSGHSPGVQGNADPEFRLFARRCLASAAPGRSRRDRVWPAVSCKSRFTGTARKARRPQRAEYPDVLHTGTRGIHGLSRVNVGYGDRHRSDLWCGRHKEVAMSVFTLSALLSVGSLAVGVRRIADAAGRSSCVDRRPSPASARPSRRCAQWRIAP